MLNLVLLAPLLFSNGSYSNTLLFNNDDLSNQIQLSFNTINTLKNYDLEYLTFEIITDDITDYTKFGLRIIQEHQQPYDAVNYHAGSNEPYYTYFSKAQAYNSGTNWYLQFTSLESDITQNIEIEKINVYYANNKSGSGTLSEQIIDGITGGLGLMSPIADEFLTGFSTLFWDATANSGAGGLTTLCFNYFCSC